MFLSGQSMAGIIAAIANIMSISFSNDGETFLYRKIDLNWPHKIVHNWHFYENPLNKDENTKSIDDYLISQAKKRISIS